MPEAGHIQGVARSGLSGSLVGADWQFTPTWLVVSSDLAGREPHCGHWNFCCLRPVSLGVSSL